MSTRATGIVGVAILSSRILGLIREQIFAGLFGAGKYLDAFLMAFRLPNLLRDLFAEGALSTAFITTFSGKIATEGDESAWRLANKVATLTAVFMSAATLLGIVFAPQLVDLLTWWSWPADKTELTIWLTRIMWPFMLLVSLAALVMGMLNAKHVFGPPAMASSYFNLGSIIGGVGIGWWLDPHFGARSLVGLAIGTLIGGAWQLIGQFPSLWKVGYRFHPDFHWRDEGVRTVLTLMGPAVIAASLPNAISSGRYFMPQSGAATSRSAETCFNAARRRSIAAPVALADGSDAGIACTTVMPRAPDCGDDT